MTEGVIRIKIRELRKAWRNKTSFIVINVAFFFKLVMV